MDALQNAVDQYIEKNPKTVIVAITRESKNEEEKYRGYYLLDGENLYAIKEDGTCDKEKSPYLIPDEKEAITTRIKKFNHMVLGNEEMILYHDGRERYILDSKTISMLHIAMDIEEFVYVETDIDRVFTIENSDAFKVIGQTGNTVRVKINNDKSISMTLHELFNSIMQKYE